MASARALAVLGLCGALACVRHPPATEIRVKPSPPASQPAPTDEVAEFAVECRKGLAEARAMLPALVAPQARRTVENTAVPHNRLLMALERTSATASVTRSVHPDARMRETAEACEQEAASFLSELMLDRAVYDAFAAVDLTGADADTRRLVERVLRDYRRAGVDRDAATRARLKAIDDELVRLGQEFSKNIVDDVRSIEIRDPAELAGLPADYVASHPPDEDGVITITTQTPDYTPFMTYADAGARRRELYVAARSRGDGKNEPVLRAILALRKEKAGLLGYPTWADYVTEDKMMKSAANAGSFIERIVATARTRGAADHAELLRMKRALIDPAATAVEDWEKGYLENKVKSASYDFDSQAVRPYFPYTRVQAGLLAITAELYDVQYAVASDARLWHPDVQAFDVMRGTRRIGRIYLDMHPREGKYQHAAQFTLRSGVRGEQLPEGALVCNFVSPKDGPALMEHDDVVTMFHEFGHLMHHILGGDQRWIYQSGVATEWDFVEAPSQMFEEWAWSHDTLARFARLDSGEAIPAELVERMRRADKFGVGLQTLQQMFYAAISLRFHTADPATLEMRPEVRRLQEKYTPFPFVEGTSFHTSFGHLEGYSALYYTYMWSLVIAKDLLTPFHRAGLMDREQATRYRDGILAAGGTRDAADLVKGFLGREFTFEAFERYLAP